MDGDQAMSLKIELVQRLLALWIQTLVEKVLQDVRQGKVSVARAREIYGVAIDATGQVDAVETARLRGP